MRMPVAWPTPADVASFILASHKIAWLVQGQKGQIIYSYETMYKYMSFSTSDVTIQRELNNDEAGPL